MCTSLVSLIEEDLPEFATILATGESHRVNQVIRCLLMSKFRRRGCQATVFDAPRVVFY
jgi:hypothetical protein